MSIIIWAASVTFVRASIVFLYIRIFPTRLFRKICYLVLLINSCFFVGTVLADCLICQPISYRWDQITGGKGSCGDEKSLDLFIGIFNLFLDVMAVVLPMPILWGLNTAVGKKVMLSCMFGMGTTYVLSIFLSLLPLSATAIRRFSVLIRKNFCSICALTIWRIYDTSTISASNAQEAYALIALLTSLEALLGIICACLPVLKPIFNKMRGTAPKGGESSRVREILKSGTIPIFMRVSQMLTLTSRKGKYSSSDEETLTETFRWYGEKKDGKSGAEAGKDASVTTKEISPPMPQKAERVMGINAQEIHVRRDVEVESVASRDERALAYEGWEGRQERR